VASCAPTHALRLTAALDASPTGDSAREVLEAMAKLELERGGGVEASRLYARRAQVAKEPREGARFLFKAATLVKETPREGCHQRAAADGGFVKPDLHVNEPVDFVMPEPAPWRRAPRPGRATSALRPTAAS
jgi:hypothetical protein